MVDKPSKRNPPDQKPESLEELANSHADLQRRHQSLVNDMTTMKWVMGFGFALVLIAFGIVSQFTTGNTRENNALRAELNALKVEFAVYKATNPPPVSPIPPEGATSQPAN